MLVPHLWVESGEWRALIDPGDEAGWTRWAESYRAFLLAWADVAREIFSLIGHAPERVYPVSTDEFAAAWTGLIAARPRNSTLDLVKVGAVGVHLNDTDAELEAHIGRDLPRRMNN